jgi:glutathionylspermidine synthase
MHLIPVKPVPAPVFEELGFYWYRSPESPDYVASDMVALTREEGDAYYRAAGELYDLFVEAGQYVIDNGLYSLLDIPESLIELIEWTWEDDAHFHIMGRFDFAGGLDGAPIKLLEFNADTPSTIFEIALVQWMLLKQNGYPEEMQFNSLYEGLKDSFVRLRSLDSRFCRDPEKIPRALFSCLDYSIEDENTTRLLEQIAFESGLATDFEYAHQAYFSKEEGIMKADGDEFLSFDYWFKLIPYEFIGREEPELASLLTEIVKARQAVLLNPPYALLFQSKSLLKILWDLFPGHPLLLETDFDPLRNRKCVEKKTLSREGANITIFGSDGGIVESTPGDYEMYRSIFQEYVDLASDNAGRLYQAGVFFSYEPCGLGFRRERGIIQDRSQFVGHIVR